MLPPSRASGGGGHRAEERRQAAMMRRQDQLDRERQQREREQVGFNLFKAPEKVRSQTNRDYCYSTQLNKNKDEQISKFQ